MIPKRWWPLSVTTRRWHFALRLGFVRIAWVRLSFAWSEYHEICPHITLEVDVWRLSAWIRIGGFHQDEDGDTRSLLSIGAAFSTYGIAEKTCRLLGHREGEAIGQYVFCDRCHRELHEAA